MVRPYLQQPNYTNAMNMGLRTRLAYDAQRRRGRGYGGGVVTAPSADRKPGAPFSPERRAYESNQMATEEALAIANEQAIADVLKTEAGTAQTNRMTEQIGFESELDKETKRMSNKMQAATIKKQDADIATQILDNAKVHFAGATRETLPDLFDWMSEGGQVPRSAFPSAEKIAGMSDVEIKELTSRYMEGSDYRKNSSTMALAQKKERILQAKEDEKEKKQFAKDKKAAHTQYTNILKDIDRIKAGGNISDFMLAKMPKTPEMQAALAGRDHKRVLEELEKLAQTLYETYGFETAESKSNAGWKQYL